jgi:tetratricopeptide (TPR) repeat protein
MGKAFQRMAMLLSICLSAGENELTWLSREVWGSEGTDSSVVAQVLSWPFVEETGDGYRILPAFGAALARLFQRADPEAFVRAHSIMAEHERLAMERAQSIQDSTDFLDGWFARGRLAYYLAGVHPDESSYEFGHAFEESMSLDANITRIWLSTLVIRQRHLLEDHLRVVNFFFGFRAYTAYRIDEAKSYFDKVLEDDALDLYRAIALHLSALTVKEISDRLRPLRDSIELSHKLNLTQNEIMARNSLAAAYLTIGSKVPVTAERRQHLEEAVSLAEENLAASALISDKSYRAVCLSMHATTVWNTALLTKGDLRQLYDGVIEELTESIAAADQSYQNETALITLNQRASVNRDYGNYGDAIEDIKEAIERLSYGVESIRIKSRLGKTAGSLLKNVPSKLRPDVQEVLDELDHL